MTTGTGLLEIQHPRSASTYHCLFLEIVRTQNCRKLLHACAEPYNALPCSLVGMVIEENEQNPFLKSHDVLHTRVMAMFKMNLSDSFLCLPTFCDFCHCSLFSSTSV